MAITGGHCGITDPVVCPKGLLWLDLSRGQVSKVSKSPVYLGALGSSRGYKFPSLSLCCWGLSAPRAAAEGVRLGSIVPGQWELCWGSQSLVLGTWQRPDGAEQGLTAVVAVPGVRGWH